MGLRVWRLAVHKAFPLARPRFAGFAVHFIVIRRTDAGVADALNPAAHADLAFRSGYQTRHFTHHQGQQQRHPKRAQANPDTAARTAVHHVA